MASNAIRADSSEENAILPENRQNEERLLNIANMNLGPPSASFDRHGGDGWFGLRNGYRTARTIPRGYRGLGPHEQLGRGFGDADSSWSLSLPQDCPFDEPPTSPQSAGWTPSTASPSSSTGGPTLLTGVPPGLHVASTVVSNSGRMSSNNRLVSDNGQLLTATRSSGINRAPGRRPDYQRSSSDTGQVTVVASGRGNIGERTRDTDADVIMGGVRDTSEEIYPRGLHLLEPGEIIASIPMRRSPSSSGQAIPATSTEASLMAGQRREIDGHSMTTASLPPSFTSSGVSTFEMSATISTLTLSTDGLFLLEPTIIGVPKQILHGYYGKMPSKVQLSKHDYFTWHQGPDHTRRFTCIFVCPVTGERFPSCAYGLRETFEVKEEQPPAGGNSPGSGARVVWYQQKIQAEHAAAARACDCLCLRFSPDSDTRLGRDPPYHHESQIILPTIPEDIERSIQARNAAREAGVNH